MSNINKYFAPIRQLRGCRIICGAAIAWGGKGGSALPPGSPQKKVIFFIIKPR